MGRGHGSRAASDVCEFNLPRASTTHPHSTPMVHETRIKKLYKIYIDGPDAVYLFGGELYKIYGSYTKRVP
jgi:hypothetical protein